MADEKLGQLRQLLAGEEVVHDGRRMRVTPQPRTPGGPMTMWGGASLAAARRAGRNGLGLLHDAVAYGEWNPDNTFSANITRAKTVDEAAERVAGGEVINLSPLCGGMPPEIAWPYLKRFADLS